MPLINFLLNTWKREAALEHKLAEPEKKLQFIEYLELWDLLWNFNLSESDDHYSWRHSNNGIFSSKSAYRLFFYGSIPFEPWRRLCKSWTRSKCKAFIWLAIKNKCWTADQLKKRGAPPSYWIYVLWSRGDSPAHLGWLCLRKGVLVQSAVTLWSPTPHPWNQRGQLRTLVEKV